MDSETIRITLQTIGNFMGLILAPLMAIILARKLYQEYKETNQLNIVRCYMLGIFIVFTWALYCANLYESTPIKEIISEEIIGTAIFTINLYSIGVGLMVTLALSMIAYANRWHIFYYTSFFIFGGIIIFYLLTGYDNWYQYYIYLSAIIGLIFFYITGFRLKDNSSLGLGVFFTIAFLAMILGETIISQLFNIGFNLFGIFFVLGYFRLFKEKEEI